MKSIWFSLFSKILFTCFCLCGVSGIIKGQLCQGSLGDPAVNITFGAGPNFGMALPAGVTNCSYTASTCPNDGQYTIANATSACFGNTWFTVPQDHTPGDANGYMMVINASFSSGDFYVDTVRGLCGNTTYEFASWILNLLNANATCRPIIYPNVTFSIETTAGTVLQTFQTGNVPALSGNGWIQYGFNFATPLNVTDVVIRMTNNAPGGCGNDLILDDITFRPCGAKVTATLQGGGTLKDVCSGDTTSLVISGSVSAGYSNPFYQWQISSNNGTTWTDIPGATTTTYRRFPTVNGDYLYRLTVAEAVNILIPKCRVNSDNITVRVNALPVPNAGNSGPVCEGLPITLTAANGENYSWSGPSGFTSNSTMPVINGTSVAAAGKYYVVVSTSAGCVNTDSTVVSVVVSPVANAGADTNVCQGSSVLLQGSGGQSFAWLPVAGLSAANIAGPVASPADSTLYILKVSNGNCSDTDSVLIAVVKKPTVSAGPDQQVFEGSSAALKGSVSGTGIIYYWTPNYNIITANDLLPTVTPASDTTYTLHVESQYGCGFAEDNVFVRVFKKLIVPNVFSPNGDGINDDFRIEGLITFPEADLVIFNRYGQLVFTTRGYAKPWDGKYKSAPLPVGTYYYIIDLKNGLKKLTGSVTILR